MDLSLTQKKLNALMKGKPVQLKYSDLTSTKPNTKVHLGRDMLMKIQRAQRESRGVRISLTPEERASVETSLKGGKIVVPKALKDLGNKIVSVAKKVGSEAKPFVRPLIKGVADVGIAGLSTLAGSPELAPIASSVGNTAIDMALDKANIGIGMKKKSSSSKKGSTAMKEKMAKLRAMRGKGVDDRVVSVVKPDGEKVRLVRGYGVSKPEFDMVKQSLVDHFTPHVPTAAHAKALAGVVMKRGVAPLSQESFKGGKFTFKKLGKTIVKGAKQLWEKAKPVAKHFAEQGLEVVKEGAKKLAAEYGVPESVTEKLVEFGEKEAKKGLDKYITSEPSQTPLHASQKFIGEAGDYARSKGHEAISKYVPSELQDVARTQLEDKLGSYETLANESALSNLGGYGLGSTLMNYTHPATTPYLAPPNLPQGQIGVGKGMSRVHTLSGGSFRGYGGSFCC